jgi:hypothetical protein
MVPFELGEQWLREVGNGQRPSLIVVSDNPLIEQLGIEANRKLACPAAVSQ